MNSFFKLFDLLGELARRRYQAAEREFAVLGINHTEARLLNLLHTEGGAAHQEALSHFLTVDRSNSGRALKNLQQKGYIARSKDAIDKRANLVQITSLGQQLVTEISKLKHQMVQHFFGALTENEAETVVALLSKTMLPQSGQPSVRTLVSSNHSNTEMSSLREKAFWNKRYTAKELIWTAEANCFLKAEVAGMKPGRALDLACGEGRNAIWLAEQGWQVKALDLSDVAIEKAKHQASVRKVADFINFEVTDLCRDTPMGQGFDLVTLIYLQLPETDLSPILKRAALALTPNGTLLVIAHDSSNLNRGYGGPQNPALLYTAGQVLTALDGTLEIEKAGIVERTVETEDGTKVARDCLVRCRRV